jgi:hypothetical protein
MHTLFFQFSCGHDYFDTRVSGGVSDCCECLCDSCQPYDGVVVVDHPCRFCGGSFSYLRNAPQIRLLEHEAEDKKKTSTPLFNRHRVTA